MSTVNTTTAGTLAELCHRYRAEVCAFSETHHPTDESFDQHAGETWRQTEREILARSATTAGDALALLDMARDEMNEVHELGDGDLARKLLDKVRGYLGRAL